jgi:hypothetical protein
MAEDGGSSDHENHLILAAPGHGPLLGDLIPGEWPSDQPSASTVGLFQGSSGNALNNSTAIAAHRDVWNVENLHFHLPQASDTGPGPFPLLQPLQYIISTFTSFLTTRTAVTVGSPQQNAPSTTAPRNFPTATPGLAEPDETDFAPDDADVQASETTQARHFEVVSCPAVMLPVPCGAH